MCIRRKKTDKTDKRDKISFHVFCILVLNFRCKIIKKKKFSAGIY